MAVNLPTPPPAGGSSTTPLPHNAVWFCEDQTPHVRSSFAVKSMKHNYDTKFQNVQLMDTHQFGKCLFLDGKMQSSEYDEFVYHESLVHPALLLHPNPKTVFVGGGGELATVREVLKHKSVESVVMVDIDGDVVEIAKKDMREWNEGVCDDPRLKIHYEDALGFIENYEGKFDVIIMDIADPVDAGPGYMLYTKDFYEFAIKKMTVGGVLVSQCGGGSIHLVKDCFSHIHCTMKSVFQYVSPYTADIPSFASSWAFALAFNDGNAFDGKPLNAESFASADTGTVDKLIEDRINGELKFYDGVTHRGIFGLGKHVRKALAEETHVITKDDPVFVF